MELPPQESVCGRRHTERRRPLAWRKTVKPLLLGRLADQFGLRTVGVDYMVTQDGGRYLLEVNHVPNVTVFPEVREAYLDLVVRWANGPTSA